MNSDNFNQNYQINIEMMNDHPVSSSGTDTGKDQAGSWPFTCLDFLITSPSHGSLYEFYGNEVRLFASYRPFLRFIHCLGRELRRGERPEM